MEQAPTDDDVRRAKGGDDAALARLIRDLQPRIRTAARPMIGPALRSRTHTSDILQSTFLDVVTSVGDFRGETAREFEHWVVRILQNNVRDAHKYFRAGKRSAGREDGGAAGDELASTRPSPSREAAATEELVLLGRALQHLSGDFRRILLMHMRPGYDHATAAVELGRSVGATRVLLARARAALLCEMDRLRGPAGGP